MATYDAYRIVKLVQNYRSHHDILTFSNEQFYRRELQVCASREKTHRIVDGRWKGLAKRDVPVIFHSVRGKDGRENNSPSYYNTDEIVLVKEYIEDLLSDKKLGLSTCLTSFWESAVDMLPAEPEDIGVITPYRAQKTRIKSRIGSFAKGTTVGSVEEFQGQVGLEFHSFENNSESMGFLGATRHHHLNSTLFTGLHLL